MLIIRDIQTSPYMKVGQRPQKGCRFENFIVCEALKCGYNKGKDRRLSFYRDRLQNEINRILRYADRFDDVEIKST